MPIIDSFHLSFPKGTAGPVRSRAGRANTVIHLHPYAQKAVSEFHRNPDAPAIVHNENWQPDEADNPLHSKNMPESGCAPDYVPLRFSAIFRLRHPLRASCTE